MAVTTFLLAYVITAGSLAAGGMGPPACIVALFVSPVVWLGLYGLQTSRGIVTFILAYAAMTAVVLVTTGEISPEVLIGALPFILIIVGLASLGGGPDRRRPNRQNGGGPLRDPGTGWDESDDFGGE